MSSITDSFPLESPSGLHPILDEPEQDGLLRLTRLVERLFHVPVAYIALLGPDVSVVTRIGSGSEYWENMKTYPLPAALAKPQVWPDPSGVPALGFNSGDLQFAAWAPLRSSDGLELGLLVIADTHARPEFSQTDHETLGELADVLAVKMELRTMACDARETEFSRQEAESRFRNIADSAPVLIIYSCADGGTSFVNRTWLEFTGRTLEEELGDGYAESLHPDYRESVMQTYWEAFQARGPLTVEFPMRRHDGEYRWMLARGMPRVQDDGTFAGYISCLVDATDQRAVSLDLQKQTQCTAAVAEASGALYLILDPQGRIEQMSSACQRNSGRDPGSMYGRFLWEACDAAMPASAAICAAIQRASSSRETVETSTAGILWTFTPIQSGRDELIALAATAVELNGNQSFHAACNNFRCACPEELVPR